jgi:hypothetical protein
MALKRVILILCGVYDNVYTSVGGRGGCCEVCGVIQNETASSADLGGSSKYSNANFED